MSSTLPETTKKFTPEQCLRLGQVYAMILRWNREDELRARQAGHAVLVVSDSEQSAAFAEIPVREE